MKKTYTMPGIFPEGEIVKQDGVVKLTLHFRPDMKAEAEEPKKPVEKPKRTIKSIGLTPFLKEGDIWKFVEKVRNDIFILKKLNMNNKIFEIPASRYTIIINNALLPDPSHPQSRNAPQRVPTNDYEVLHPKDVETISVDGFEIEYILLPKNSLGWSKFVKKEQEKKFKIELLPNKFGDFKYCIGDFEKKVFKKKNDTKSLLFYNSAFLDFCGENQDFSLYGVKFDRFIQREEKLNKLIEDDIFYIDHEKSFGSPFSILENITIEQKGVATHLEVNRIFEIMGNFQTRKKV